MNLLITGGCGFIGSNFINNLKVPFNKLVNFDALYYCANQNNVEEHIRKDPRYFFVKGDLCLKDFVSYVLSEHKTSDNLNKHIRIPCTYE